MAVRPEVGIIARLQDNATAQMQKLGQRAQQTASRVAGANQQMAASAAQVVQKQSRLNALMSGGAAKGMMLGSSMLMVYSAYDRIGTVQASVASAEASLQSAHDAVTAAQLRVNTMVEKGETDTEKYKLAVDKLSTAKQRYQAYQIRMADLQDEVNKAQLQFALSAGPAALMMMGQFQGMKGMGGMTKSTNQAAVATNRLGFAMKMMPILAVAGLVALLVTHLYQATDGFKDWGGVIQWFQGLWRGFLNAIQPVINTITSLIGILQNAWNWMQKLAGFTPMGMAAKALGSIIPGGQNFAGIIPRDMPMMVHKGDVHVGRAARARLGGGGITINLIGTVIDELALREFAERIAEVHTEL